jgi:hypothetical protein
MILIAFGTGPGSGGRASMAKVIIGGQMLCLLLTLLVTPVSYSIFDDWGAGKFSLFWRRRAARKDTSTVAPPVRSPALGGSADARTHSRDIPATTRVAAKKRHSARHRRARSRRPRSVAQKFPGSGHNFPLRQVKS